jgi:hypothetical protein
MSFTSPFLRHHCILVHMKVQIYFHIFLMPELHQIMSYHSAVVLLALELLFHLETHIATVELMILEMYVH